MKRRLFLASLVWPSSSSLYASVSGDLDNYFTGLGFASNTTSPGAYQSQAAGFFGGGSLFVRDYVRQYQLVQLDLPSYRAGCNGIDLFTGSLSFLSEQKLVDLGKAVMTNAGAYAVDVMLASTVPQLKQVRDYLQQLEQMANQTSINSCQLAQNMVGGVYPKTTESQLKICKDQAVMGKEGMLSDYVKGRMECSTSKGFNAAMANAKNDPERKKQVVLNKNIVWSILQSKSFFKDNAELAEMAMSLTGTLIFDNDGKVKSYPSLAGKADLFNAMIGLGAGEQTAEIWRCDDLTAASECLSLSLKAVVVPEKSTLVYQARNIINSIRLKLTTDVEPDAAEKSFLSTVSLPVMKFLSVMLSTQYASAAVDIEEYSMLIAQDMLTNYLNGLLTEIGNATAGSELNESLVKLIQQRVTDATAKVAALDPKVGRKLQEKLALIERMARIEKQVAADIKI